MVDRTLFVRAVAHSHLQERIPATPPLERHIRVPDFHYVFQVFHVCRVSPGLVSSRKRMPQHRREHRRVSRQGHSTHIYWGCWQVEVAQLEVEMRLRWWLRYRRQRARRGELLWRVSLTSRVPGRRVGVRIGWLSGFLRRERRRFFRRSRLFLEEVSSCWRIDFRLQGRTKFLLRNRCRLLVAE